MKNVPAYHFPATEIKKANQSITIHKGNFHLKSGQTNIEVIGKITFCWLPQMQIKFSGKTKDNLFSQKMTEAITLHFCDASAEAMILTRSSNGTISGIIRSQLITGNKSQPVAYAAFEICNMRELTGDTIVHGNQYWRGRLVFESDIYIIEIDKLPNYKKLENKLEDSGGYNFLYSGIVKRKDGKNELFENLQAHLDDFTYFLYFINGRRCAPVFTKGFLGTNNTITKYTAGYTDMYKFVQSWTTFYSTINYTAMWQNFLKAWQSENERRCLQIAIHWYVESNSNNGLIEASLVMIQNGLELFYNWLVEKKLIGQTKFAADKIRSLLQYCSLTATVPVYFQELQKYCKECSLKDAPQALTELRNAIVHNNKAKRDKLEKASKLVIFQAVHTGIWYVELLLLKRLGYNSHYLNRCNDPMQPMAALQLVPWAISSA